MSISNSLYPIEPEFINNIGYNTSVFNPQSTGKAFPGEGFNTFPNRIGGPNPDMNPAVEADKMVSGPFFEENTGRPFPDSIWQQSPDNPFN